MLPILIKEDDFKFFLDLGMTKSQTKIYLSLLKLGMESNAASLFDISGVARQDVYRVLLELQKLGIVEKIITSPNRFRAVSPLKASSILLEEKNAYFNDLNKKAICIAKEISDNYGKSNYSTEKNQIVAINEKKALILKCREAIGKCKLSIDCIAPFNELPKWMTSCSQSFDLARNNGVKIRWITQKPENEESLTQIFPELIKNPKMEVKVCPNISLKLGIYDKEETILAVFSEGTFAENSALWTNSPAIITLASNFFESNWKKGKRLRRN